MQQALDDVIDAMPTRVLPALRITGSRLATASEFVDTSTCWQTGVLKL